MFTSAFRTTGIRAAEEEWTAAMKGYSIVTGWSVNMQSLVVRSLALRQLGRLPPRRLLAVGFGLRPTAWSPRSLSSRQLWGSPAPGGLRGPGALGGHRGPGVLGRDAQPLRNKSKKRSAYGSMREEEEEEEEEKEEEKEEASDQEEEDPGQPKDYKDLDKHVQSFRYDVIVKAGLDVARNKIEDAFYSNKLRLNGQKLIKKSKTVKVGDTLDLVLSEDQDSVTLMRVELRKAFGETGSSPEKHRVSVRRWKNLQLPRNEAFKA
ncbi:uncharacterized protein ACNS7B_000678 isoform 1-T1 [Menidia menidia]